eukprot:TRINITY_DN12029_c0_g1_i2.p1 TRINITY_DN12029_c0_g1~~TRINITY_DN12029_c0_g1_i2.p1  ORF type:complete len:537 (-),score=45.41 TRINITY_DN12029_c0_g1_i2:616-2226(-)
MENSGARATLASSHGIRREKAKAQLLEIVVDKSTIWRARMMYSLGDMIKASVLEDPDMWPPVRRSIRALLDHAWADIEHEIERSLHNTLARLQTNASLEGPGAQGILGLWYRFRAWFLWHYLPFDKSIFGKLKDPVYCCIYSVVIMPAHGIRVVIFAVMLLMLLFPGPPDECQLIHFILLNRGTQFFTSGILTLAVGAMKYFACFSMHKDRLLDCMEDSGPSASGSTGLVLDYFGSVALVWIAFLALPQSRNHAREWRTLRDDETADYGSEYGDASTLDYKRGGRLRSLLSYDMACLSFSLVTLLLLTLGTCHVFSSPWREVAAQFRANVFWCCVLYSCSSFPFFFFMIPGVQSILTHSDKTGFNQFGVCVEYSLAKIQIDEDDVAHARAQDAVQERGIFDRVAPMMVGVLNTIQAGQDARGAAADDIYRPFDFTRGLIAQMRSGRRDSSMSNRSYPAGSYNSHHRDSDASNRSNRSRHSSPAPTSNRSRPASPAPPVTNRTGPPSPAPRSSRSGPPSPAPRSHRSGPPSPAPSRR